jgi:uncharacterized membrane protein SpoIIM required for sporulation
MVLESIVVPDSWEKHPRRMFVIGFLYSSIGIALGYWVFGRYASLAGIFLTTIPLVVIMYKAIYLEEHRDLRVCSEYFMFRGHVPIMKFFICLFLGVAISYSFWYSTLEAGVSSNMFSSQIETIKSVRGLSTIGQAISREGAFSAILSNNLRVWAFCVFFSVLYGAGAIFIIIWNASILGVAMGMVIRDGMSHFSFALKHNVIVGYLATFPVGVTYLIHGVPEVLSYFIGALSGGIVSVAIVCHHYRSCEFWAIMKDAITLAVLSLILLVISAFIEVHITPAFL